MTPTDTKAPEAQPKPQSPLATIAHGLELRREQFRAMLPSHITAEHFERVVMTAVMTDPDLLSADRRSFFTSCAKAAADGLLPDKREGALVVFKDNNTHQKLVTWMPMTWGLIKRIRQSGEISTIGARIVYQREIDEQSLSHPTRKRFEFVISDGDEKLFHEPILWGERGQKVMVYAYARFKDGTVQYAPLHKDDVLKRRKIARTDKVWTAWEDEMWMKTAIRALAGKMPVSRELPQDVRSALDRDVETTEFDKMKGDAMAALAGPVDTEDGALIDGTTGEITAEPPAAEPDKKTISAEDYIANATEGLSDPGFVSVLELEEYAQRIRMGLTTMLPPGNERSRLLKQFNAAATERINALHPEPRQ